MMKLREAENWSQIGFKSLSDVQLINLLKIFGKEGIQSRDILNSLYTEVITYRFESAQKCFILVESLLKFGMNYLSVDYYFAFLSLAHTFCLNRHDFTEAAELESYMVMYLSINKKKAQTAQCWLQKVERLVKMQKFQEAQLHIYQVIGLCSTYGLLEVKF